MLKALERLSINLRSESATTSDSFVYTSAPLNPYTRREFLREYVKVLAYTWHYFFSSGAIALRLSASSS
jgi:hypothetical protein